LNGTRIDGQKLRPNDCADHLFAASLRVTTTHAAFQLL